MTSWALVFSPVARDDARRQASTLIAGVSSDVWVARIRAGDTDALSTVYRALRDRLWRFAVTLLDDDARAHDVVQDVFVALWARRETLDVRGDLLIYLFGAVRHEAGHVRRHQRVVHRFADAEAAVPFEPVDAHSPESVTERNDLRRAVQRVIDTLPPRDRAALMLRWIEERTYEDIGRVLGISSMGAHKMVMRALTRVRPLLEQLR